MIKLIKTRCCKSLGTPWSTSYTTRNLFSKDEVETFSGVQCLLCGDKYSEYDIVKVTDRKIAKKKNH